MIKVIDVATKARTPVPDGTTRAVLGPSHEGTRVEVAIRELEPGKALRAGPTERTQVVYILEGEGATVTCSSAGTSTQRPMGRRAGIYLEPSEQATISAGQARLVLLIVTVPKHTGKAATASAPGVGYCFEEAQLRSLIDEKGVRERTFWVNTETGLSGSWDLQIGRMQYAPRAHSPRHVHHPSKTSAIVPEHFYFIETGTGEVKHDHGTLPVGPGSLVLIPSGEWHQLIASDSGFDYIEFQAPFDFVTTMDHDPLGKNWYIKGTDDGTGKPQRWVQS
jgi:mannose-6-phosphate isomerase-like protein (cupin superfamily)